MNKDVNLEPVPTKNQSETVEFIDMVGFNS